MDPKRECMQLNNCNHLFSLIIAGCYLACSSSDPNTPAVASGGTLGAAGSTAGTTTTGNAGTATGSGGTSAGGGGSGGVSTLPNAGSNAGGADAGAGGVAAGAGGTAQGGSSGESAGGTAGAGGSVASTVPEGPFVCSQVLGLLSSGEWYNAGFEDALNEGEGDHWQGTFVHYGYVNIWADPMGYTWDEGLSSNCTEGSDAPERLLFQAVSWELTDQAAWETQLEAALTTIISKFPSAIRIDLMPLIRCPDNGYCHDDDPPLDYQPGYNMDATKQDCHIPDFVDAAFETVAANHPGLVKLTPKFEAHNCAPNIDGIHLGPENGPVAIDIANYVKGQSAL